MDDNIYIYIYIYIYVCVLVISIQRAKTVSVDDSYIENMKNILKIYVSARCMTIIKSLFLSRYI